jgi:hypothetical protein
MTPSPLQTLSARALTRLLRGAAPGSATQRAIQKELRRRALQQHGNPSTPLIFTAAEMKGTRKTWGPRHRMKP